MTWVLDNAEPHRLVSDRTSSAASCSWRTRRSSCGASSPPDRRRGAHFPPPAKPRATGWYPAERKPMRPL